jgi:hypothetical protein
VFLFHDFFKEVKRRFTGELLSSPSPPLASSAAYGSDDEDDQPTNKVVIDTNGSVAMHDRIASRGKSMFNTEKK